MDKSWTSFGLVSGALVYAAFENIPVDFFCKKAGTAFAAPVR
jgi:hypothetical protein